jgi:peptidyl-prolyl cis-trans isomerase C
MTRPAPLAAALIGAALIAACTQKPATDAKPAAAADSVAMVDGREISRNTFNQYVKGVAGKPAEDLSPEQRTELLDNLIRADLIAAEADRSGLAARDETRAVLELSRLSILQQASSAEYLKDRKASDEELRAEYDLQVAKMDKTQYRASHILVPTEEAAKEIIAQLKGGANFAQIAKARSTDKSSAERGGDLDWFAPGSMTPPFAEAVRKLKKGETTAEPVKTEFGWHVLRVTDTRDTAPPPFESVKDRLVQIVESKKFNAWVDGLVQKATVAKTL